VQAQCCIHYLNSSIERFATNNAAIVELEVKDALNRGQVFNASVGHLALAESLGCDSHELYQVAWHDLVDQSKAVSHFSLLALVDASQGQLREQTKSYFLDIRVVAEDADSHVLAKEVLLVQVVFATPAVHDHAQSSKFPQKSSRVFYLCSVHPFNGRSH